MLVASRGILSRGGSRGNAPGAGQAGPVHISFGPKAGTGATATQESMRETTHWRKPTRCGAIARGFTLVELVAVIVVLGILAVVAIPRFLDVTHGAYKAVVAQTAAAFTTALTQAHLGCVIASHAGKDNLATFGRGDVDFNSDCYPSSTNGNNGNVSAARCLQIWNGMLASPPTISTPASDTTDYRAQGAGKVCTYTFRKDSSATRRFTYNTASGAVALTNP